MPSVEFSAGNRIEFLHCGAEFFPALIKSIDAASTEIYLETYLFATDDAVRADSILVLQRCGERWRAWWRGPPCLSNGCKAACFVLRPRIRWRHSWNEPFFRC